MQHLQLTVPPSRILANCIEIIGVRGIGRTRSQSLGGEFGSLFWIDMWEYHRAFGRHGAFVKGLVDESVYDTPEQDRLAALTTVRDGSFSCTPTRVRRLQPGPLLRAARRDTSTTRAFVHAAELAGMIADFAPWWNSRDGLQARRGRRLFPMPGGPP